MSTIDRTVWCECGEPIIWADGFWYHTKPGPNGEIEPSSVWCYDGQRAEPEAEPEPKPKPKVEVTYQATIKDGDLDIEAGPFRTRWAAWTWVHDQMLLYYGYDRDDDRVAAVRERAEGRLRGDDQPVTVSYALARSASAATRGGRTFRVWPQHNLHHLEP